MATPIIFTIVNFYRIYKIVILSTCDCKILVKKTLISYLKSLYLRNFYDFLWTSFVEISTCLDGSPWWTVTVDFVQLSGGFWMELGLWAVAAKHSMTTWNQTLNYRNKYQNSLWRRTHAIRPLNRPVTNCSNYIIFRITGTSLPTKVFIKIYKVFRKFTIKIYSNKF